MMGAVYHTASELGKGKSRRAKSERRRTLAEPAAARVWREPPGQRLRISSRTFFGASSNWSVSIEYEARPFVSERIAVA